MHEVGVLVQPSLHARALRVVVRLRRRRRVDGAGRHGACGRGQREGRELGAEAGRAEAGEALQRPALAALGARAPRAQTGGRRRQRHAAGRGRGHRLSRHPQLLQAPQGVQSCNTRNTSISRVRRPRAGHSARPAGGQAAILRPEAGRPVGPGHPAAGGTRWNSVKPTSSMMERNLRLFRGWLARWRRTLRSAALVQLYALPKTRPAPNSLEFLRLRLV